MKLATVSLSAAALATAFAQQDSSSVSGAAYTTAAASSSAGAAMQSATDTETSTVTAYVDDCSTSSAPGSSSAGAGMNSLNSGTLTTYTTVFQTWCGCEARTTGVTYTIIEPCSKTGHPLPPGHVPSGFTTTTEACPACPTPTTAVITKPVGTAPVPAYGPGPAVVSPSTGATPAPVIQPAVQPTVQTTGVAPSNSTTGCTGANGACSSPIEPATGSGVALSASLFASLWSVMAAAMALL